MSILNHFGKVKASYKKYEGDLPEYTGYVYKSGPSAVIPIDFICFENGKINEVQEIGGCLLYKPNDFYGNPSLSYTYQHVRSPEKIVFSFTTLVETFSKCFEKVREKMYSDLWKTIECCPFINIMDLLILKQSDTDKHIEHVENMIRSLLDDNKLLQNRINALETQMKRNNIPVAVVVKTIGEELVYESV
jgi:hypothetical protein